MLDLFLSEPNWKEADSAEMRVPLLNKLESVIWSLMASGGRSEARLWLCNTIAGIGSITHHHQRELFIDLLRSKPLKKRLATQLLHMIFDNRPQKAGSVISKRSYALRKFFQGNPTRISQWFSKTGSGLRQGQGANALSQFAFVNRDNCWEELEWKGKHGQSPAVVATKPHYFLDLDVQQTVENFLENVPEFWSSNEFSESLKVFNYGRQLLRLLRDEGAPEDQAKLQDIVSEICAIPGNENSMAPIIKGGSKLKTIEAFKLMGLQSWVLFFSLSEKCQTPQSWESLFVDNEISFRKYDKYSFLHDNEVAGEGGSDLDYRGSKKVKRRKKTSSRRKRRRDFDHDDNELLDSDTTNNRLDLHSSVGSWLLSLDGYSASWNSADLPEYLSKYCLSTWMKWALAQWDQ